ncbi:hypothetical protein KC711_07425 [Candidatus Peregrinibacteria bacterium]|nr:hypothetical protein [Candidatus Peregrinibacteria bacterium]
MTIYFSVGSFLERVIVSSTSILPSTTSTPSYTESIHEVRKQKMKKMSQKITVHHDHHHDETHLLPDPEDESASEVLFLTAVLSPPSEKGL